MKYFRALTYYRVCYSAYKPSSDNTLHSLNLRCWIWFDKEWYMVNNANPTDIINSYNICKSLDEMKKLTDDLIKNGILVWE